MAFGYLLTQEENVIHSSPALSLKKKAEMREGHREELTGLRQTQKMAAALDPLLSPTLQIEHTQASC